ncbi:amino acid transporter AVT3B-like isoform X1 [Haliotis rufescens]|uniref:amino acid transporter AVT3B-like isoform X1 n=1 Tax=Haliotis rufescens TaxID=6454 RepID=UPI00201E8195|nr:amino acid transporter AVT3B-like isoform X1 [Haliotis rufescens]
MSVGGGNQQGGSTHPLKIFASIFISFIGAGVLGLPFAFKEAGIIEGAIIMSFVGVISVKAMLLIIDCKYQILEKRKSKKGYGNSSSVDEDGLTRSKAEVTDLLKGEGALVIRVKDPPMLQTSDLTYGDVGYEALGHTGRFLVDLAIVVSQTGFCCAYLIFISENLSDYFKGMRIGHWLLILLPPLCLLTLLRHLSSLSISSLMAQCSNLMAFAVVFWFDFEHLNNIEYCNEAGHMVPSHKCLDEVFRIHPKNMSVRGFPFFLAIAIYCYEGAGMILSLESSLAVEVRHKFRKFFITTMCIVTTLYISFGACGYLSFGPETNQIITLNLPKGQSIDFSMIVKSFLCIALYCTYPVMMFPVMKILERYTITDADKNYLKGNILRACMVLCTGVVVLMIPNFANLMALVGASCCTLLAFILPGIFHLRIFSQSLSLSQKVTDWSLIAIGVIGTLIGTIDAINRLYSNESTERPALTISTLTTTVANATSSVLSTTTTTTISSTTLSSVVNNVTKALKNPGLH